MRDDDILLDILCELQSIARTDRQILQILRKNAFLTAGRVIFMPKSVSVGQSSTATLLLQWSDGVSRQIDASYQVLYTTSDPSVATADPPQSNGATMIHALVPGSASIGAVVTQPDGSQVTMAADTLTVTQPVIVSGSVLLQ